MNWDHVRYFVHLARTGTLVGAAKALAVEHTTVARRVTSLEEAVGVRLFDRLPRGWRLTDEGRGLLAQAEALEGEAAAFARRATALAGVAGTVRISAAPVLVTHFLVPHLAALSTLHPDLDIEATADRHSVNLLRGETDLALRIGSFDIPPGLIARALGHVGYGLYGTAAAAGRAEQARTFLGFDASMRDSAHKQWLDDRARGRRVAFRSNDLLALYQAARAGMGLALLPHLMVDPDDGLVRIDVDDTFERPLSLLLHPDLRRAPRVAATVRFLVRLARTEAGTLSGRRGRRS
jgi:DNA-binding transcriptional LysR family regulator